MQRDIWITNECSSVFTFPFSYIYRYNNALVVKMLLQYIGANDFFLSKGFDN